ncbi:MAG: nucleoside triphosphate pyrophosphohydrolase [Mariprofundaceae bacterium]|nr:nucleoside triphosphate pyrophosphohydrolase [Mariprofundaceae bacterium]
MPDRILNQDNYFSKLDALMKVLREECPWDNEQTLSSLRTYTLEETHEVLEAIDKAVDHSDWSSLKNELGDLLIQIAFYSVIADEHGEFNLGDVFESLIQKMIYRHPHVFGDARPSDVLEQWEQLKDDEHKERRSLMDGIPPLPALAYALKLQKRAARVGFDWKEAADVIEKMEEELSELALEVRSGAAISRIEDEFGDVLFTLVNLGRKLGLDAEVSLMHTNRKFSERFRGIETLAEKRDLNLSGLDLEALEGLYRESRAEIEKRNMNKGKL